jgi:hypothetical protein
MQRVYANGFCNISSASADGPEEGLFFDRDVKLMEIPTRIRAAWKLDVEYTILSEFEEYIYAALDREPLYQRGWVIQERLLSQRNISFTRNMIFFECADTISCEMNPKGQLHWKVRWLPCFRNRTLEFAGIDLNILLGIRALKTKKEYLEYWRLVLKFYSAAALSFETDKMVALSGLAEGFYQRLGCQYLAGLWSESIYTEERCDIAWIRVGDTSSRPTAYRAPSWSWVSLDSAIMHLSLHNRLQLLAILVDCSVNPETSPDCFRNCMNGAIRFKGLLLQITLSDFESSMHHVTIQGDLSSKAHGRYKRAQAWMDDPIESETITCNCIPIFHDPDFEIYLLLLQPSDNRQSTYRRIGIGRFGDFKQGYFDEFLQSVSDREQVVTIV